MLDGGSSGKDDVIDMIEQSSHTYPLHGPKHVFIIEEIDQLSSAAKNAFHKILERPSPYVHFILLSMMETNGNKIPRSIADRAQPYYFKNLTEQDVAYTMKGILEKEGLWADLPPEFKKEGIFLLVNNSGGSLRRGLQYLERAIIGEFFTVKEIEDNFKFLSESNSLSLLKFMIAGNDAEVVRLVEELRREVKLYDWLGLSSYFMLKADQSKLVEGFDDTPSTRMLLKLDTSTYDKVRKGILEMEEKARSYTYMPPTTIAHGILHMYANIKEAMALKNIPVRG